MYLRLRVVTSPMLGNAARSSITLPRSGYMLGMAVQPEKMNEVDVEPSTS